MCSMSTCLFLEGLKNEMAHTSELPLSSWEHVWVGIVKEAQEKGNNVQLPSGDTVSRCV